MPPLTLDPASRRNWKRLVRPWIEVARGFMADRGFVQTERESLAETMARAPEITTEELPALIAENRIERCTAGEIRIKRER